MSVLSRISKQLSESLGLLDEKARWKVELERHKASGNKEAAAKIQAHQDARYAHTASGAIKHLKSKDEKEHSKWSKHPAFAHIVRSNQERSQREPGSDDDTPPPKGPKMAKPTGKKGLGHSVREFMKRRKDKIAQIRDQKKPLTKAGPTKAAAARTDKEAEAAMPSRETPKQKVSKDLKKKSNERKSLKKKYGHVPKHDPASPEGKMEGHLHTSNTHLARSIAARRKYEQAKTPEEAHAHREATKLHAAAHKAAASAAYAHAAQHGLDRSEHLRKKLDRHMEASHGHGSDTHLSAMRKYARGERKANPVKGVAIGRLKSSKPTDWRSVALKHHADNTAVAAAKKHSDAGAKHFERMMPSASA